MRKLNDAEIMPLLESIVRQDVDETLRLLGRYGHVDVWMANERTSLQFAAGRDCDRVASALIEHGADVEASGGFGGRTPLHIAVEHGAFATARLLIGAGAAIDKRSKYGRTALHFALRHVRHQNGAEILSLILHHGADVNVADEDGVTPADIAIDYGGKADLAMLLARGSDPNARIAGAPRLHRLAEGGLPFDYFELLIKWGADIHARDDQGCLAVDIARKLGRDSRIVGVLSG